MERCIVLGILFMVCVACVSCEDSAEIASEASQVTPAVGNANTQNENSTMATGNSADAMEYSTTDNTTNTTDNAMTSTLSTLTVTSATMTPTTPMTPTALLSLNKTLTTRQPPVTVSTHANVRTTRAANVIDGTRCTAGDLECVGDSCSKSTPSRSSTSPHHTPKPDKPVGTKDQLGNLRINNMKLIDTYDLIRVVREMLQLHDEDEQVVQHLQEVLQNVTVSACPRTSAAHRHLPPLLAPAAILPAFVLLVRL